MSFDLRLLISPLISSNFFYDSYTVILKIDSKTQIEVYNNTTYNNDIIPKPKHRNIAMNVLILN